MYIAHDGGDITVIDGSTDSVITTVNTIKDLIEANRDLTVSSGVFDIGLHGEINYFGGERPGSQGFQVTGAVMQIGYRSTSSAVA